MFGGDIPMSGRPNAVGTNQRYKGLDARQENGQIAETRMVGQSRKTGQR